ncbi:acylneuraminate cytidylyltransferase family protein [Litorivicinus sp.]|nr:acylneuraminate cytidylyltransferase family protein [Litorivicinus sp.]
MSSDLSEIQRAPKFAIIPARSGSKRVPDKNMQKINGRSLIQRAIDAALGANIPVIFSSDSQNYLDSVQSWYGDSVERITRPSDLATDTTRVVDEVRRILDIKDLAEDEFFTLLLPTSPFRNAGLLKKIVTKTLSDDSGYFTSFEYSFPVSFAFSTDQDGKWRALLGSDSPMSSGNTRSQNQEKYFHPTGGVYVQRAADFRLGNNLYENTKPFPVTEIEAIDVDTMHDLRIAALIGKEFNL